MIEKKYFSLDEAVEFLKNLGYPIKKSGMYKLTMDRKIPFQRFGKRKMIFKPDELTDWAEEQINL